VKGREHLRETAVDGRTILKWILWKQDVGVWAGLILLRTRPSADSCESDNEPSSSNSWPAGWISVCQGGLWSTVLIYSVAVNDSRGLSSCPLFPLALMEFLFLYPFLGFQWPPFLQPSPFFNIHTSILKMEPACSSETSVCAYKTTRRHNPEDHNLNNHCSENLKTPVANNIKITTYYTSYTRKY
jgi:hypothetical protein